MFALATIRDWDALEKFSKEKRPPIGKVFNSVFITEGKKKKGKPICTSSSIMGFRYMTDINLLFLSLLA